jgi:hypothetical protein
MHVARSAAASAALLATLALAACGGGGGDASPDFQVAFDHPTLAVTAYAAVPGQAARARVTLSPAPPATAVVQLTQSGTDFALAGLSITDQGGGAFDVDLPIADGLAPGAATGTLTFRLCRDAGCAQPYRLSADALPYRITVQAAPATASYDPTLFDIAFTDETARSSFLAFDVTPAPVDPPTLLVLDGGGLYTPGPADVFAFSAGFGAILPYPDSVPAGEHTGQVVIKICLDPACTQPVALPSLTMGYDLTVYAVQAGLPPSTATFSLDGTPVADPGEGLNGLGERTYAVTMAVGQVLEFTPDPSAVLTVRGLGATASLTRLPSTFPTQRFQANPLPVGATSGTYPIDLRATDGRWIRITVTVIAAT